MDKQHWIVWLIAYGACPLFGGFVIWLKQGRYLTEDQPLGFFLLGPLMPLICFLPKSMFTSRSKAYPKEPDND